MKLLKGSFFLKILSLAVAVITYFYIHNEIENAHKKETVDPSYKLIKLTAKKLPVNARLSSSAPEGYTLIEGGVKTKPSEIVVIGPEALLEDVVSAETALIDVSDSFQTVVKRIAIENVAGIHVGGEPYFVEATIPIEKADKAEKNP